MSAKMDKEYSKISKKGGHRYENNEVYVGFWNTSGVPHSEGHMLFSNGVRYDGMLRDGFPHGKGHLTFSNGATYSGEFVKGWFHGFGTFCRADGMKYEGEFRGGKIWGLGLVTFNTRNSGFPKYEGYFQHSSLMRSEKCSTVIQKAQKVSIIAESC